ncbi:MAG: hypothetical protein ACRDPW_10165 [Mycobacteriales bacterium]
MSSYDSPHGQSYPHGHISDDHQLPPAPRFRVGDALSVVGGIFVFLFSFLPFVSYNGSLRDPIERSGFDTWFNAWEAQTFMAPLTWFVVVAALASGGLSIATYLLRRQVTVLSFTTVQLQVMTSAFSFLTLLGYAVSAKSVVFGSSYAQYLGGGSFADGIDFAVGGYLMTSFALLCGVGAVMNLYNVGPALFPRGVAAPPSPSAATSG